MRDDDIEILDIFDKNKKTDEPLTRVARLEKKEELIRIEKEELARAKKEKKNIGKKKNKEEDEPVMKKKTKKKKASKFQKIFCLVSALFLLGCIGFYGYRFVKYYRIYNPKIDSSDGSVLLAKDIVGKTEFGTEEEDGLISSSGNYIYKGDVKNNYLRYNNMLWRIVRINQDNSIDIILDDYMNILPWNSKISTFAESDIYKYLNNDFIKLLDEDLLNKTSFCTDKIDDLTKITCEGQNTDSYVKLLDVANFLNSVNNGKTYLVNKDEIMWLADYSNDKIWHTNGYNVSQSDVNSFYEIRPMVRLKSTTLYKEGDGSKEKPYVVDNEEVLKVGSKIMLGEDTWIVYDNTGDIKLMREKVLEKQLDFDKTKLTYKDSSLMTYLNDTYLNSLSYKDMIIDGTYYIGEYKTSVTDIKNESVKTKVGIPNLLDYQFDSSVNGYFTGTINKEIVYVYENPLRPSYITSTRSIRPCITISKDNLSKLKYVNGMFKVGE